MNRDTYKSLALELHSAEKTRVQCELISRRYPEMTIADSYAIQAEWVKIKVAEGRNIRGHKIGFTSRAMQVAVGISEPDSGVLFDDMFFDEGACIPHNRFIAPRVEVELAFILKRAIKGPNVTIFDVLSATEWVVPAVEILDGRIESVDRVTKQSRKVLDTIADNAANAGIIVGGRPVRVDQIDMRWTGALLYKNGILEESGLAAAVLNHPANGIAWLANRLATIDQGLEAGQIVLAGSFIRIVMSKPGDVFHADFGRLGGISFSFEAAPNE